MRILFSLSSVGIREAKQIKETLISGWITTGFKTKESERLVAICCGVNHAVCLGSQTACAEMTIYIYCQCIRSLPCGSKTHLVGYTGWLMGNGLRKIAWCYHREDKGHHSCRSCRHSLWLWQDILSSWKQEIFITCKEWNSKSNRQSDCYDWYSSCICSNMVQKASRKLHGFFKL